VTVESHASTIGPRTLAFARQLPGRLEVAAGLETIHPVAAAQMNKRLDLAQFDRGARLLADNAIDLRVFVLLGAPHIAPDESVDWAVRTVEYAVERGAAIVSVIPVRGGNGEMERLAAIGEFTPPTLTQLEQVLERCLQFTGTAVTVDLSNGAAQNTGGHGTDTLATIENLTGGAGVARALRRSTAKGRWMLQRIAAPTTSSPKYGARSTGTGAKVASTSASAAS